jgi:hypothetical protein
LEDEACGICFEKFDDKEVVKIIEKCKHGYHKTCLTKWLNNEKRCPHCNTEIEI